jgi:UDP-2,3-diacylglucosamine hydrolase
MPARDKIFFASDLHLGAPYFSDPIRHEKRIVLWLESIEPEAKALYLLGDVFDYWFEYRSVVPRGFIRFLGQLARMADNGTDIHIFTGNHDVWMFDYLPSQFRCTIHESPYRFEAFGKTFFVGHGDDFGYDRGYSLLMWCFHNKFLQALYRWLHPDLANLIATTWSRRSRMSHAKHPTRIRLTDEFSVRFATEQIAKGEQVDFFVFGHRHKVINYAIPDSPARVLVIGDWLYNFTYAVFDGREFSIIHDDHE